MPYQPKSPQEQPADGSDPSATEAPTPEAAPRTPTGPSKARKTLWIVGGAVGIYYIATGIYQAITAGS